jgi:hypothetical protein
LKKLLSISFLLVYLLAGLSPFLPYLEYALNHEYIANELCVNKARPELKCNGQCYLMLRMQEMVAEQQQQESNDFPAPLAEEEFLSAHLLIDSNIWPMAAENTLSPFRLSENKLKAIYLTIPTPPPQA